MNEVCLETISGNISAKEKALTKESVPFDDAMDMTGLGKFNYGILFLCQVIFFGMIMETLGFTFVLPASQCDLNIGITERGLVASIPFITIVASSNIWGWYADTYGRKSGILISTIGGSILSILSSFMPDLISFAVLRFLAGLFISGCSSIVYTYLGELTPSHVRDRMVLLGNTALSIGSAIVPLIAWGILPLDFRWAIPAFGYDFRPWRILIICFALPYAICSIIMLKVPESPKFFYSKGRHEDALGVLRILYSVNTGRDGGTFPVSSLAVDSSEEDNKKQNLWTAAVALFTRPHLSKTLIYSFLQFCVIGITNGYYIWSPDIINKVANNPTLQSETLCSVINSPLLSAMNTNVTIILDTEICDDTLNTAAFTYSITVGILVTGLGIISAYCLKIIGKKLQLISFLLIIGTISLTLNWITDPKVSLILYLAFQLLGVCIGLANAFVVEYFPTSIRATAVGITMMMGRLGSVFCTNVFGALINSSCSTMFYLSAALMYLCAASPVFFAKPPTETKNIKREEDS